MHVAVVGTGYVGLTTGVCLAHLGHEVTCVDIDPERVAAIKRQQVPFYEPGLGEMLSTNLSNGRLKITGHIKSDPEVVFITVGTPELDGRIDLSRVEMAARQIGQRLRRDSYQVVAVKSTVVPGTTDTLVRKVLEQSSCLKAGEFGLCMNPEFLREGFAVSDFLDPDRIVIGQWDDRSGRVLAELYRTLECPKILTTLRNAEMIKYAANSLLATLISFSNEISALCEATPGTDVDVVMQGVHLDRRLSPVIDGKKVSPGVLSFLMPGCGFGGSCLPKDVNALRAFARDKGVDPALLDAVVAVNAGRPGQIVSMAESLLGTLDQAEVAVLGVAFKPGTDDTRDSPALPIIQLLAGKGARVRVYDPMVKTLPPALFEMVKICPSVDNALADADAAIVVTAWPEFLELDWADACARMRRPVIIDSRNALRRVCFPSSARYVCIGQVVPEGRV